MRLLVKSVFVLVLSCIITTATWAEIDVSEAIVKIYTTYNKHDYFEPWQMEGQRTRTGSGCIIKGKRILTNAHIVADQTFIQVKRAGEAKKFIAEVEIVAHECDLAILKVKDSSFFDGITPLEIGKLANIRDKVAVYGFSKGGVELSITEGIVSRVEHGFYTHRGTSLLRCQIDAAINSGSSGGPVIKRNKIVGVAFQSGSGENVGYMVPPPVINHFLKDIEDGIYNGIPDLGLEIQRMENQDLARKFNMGKKQTGILINKIYPGCAAEDKLQVDDIILSIDGINVENDMTIEFRKNERTFYSYVIQNKFIGDTVRFKVLRDNKTVDIDVKLTHPLEHGRLVQDEQYDVAPTYYIVGGLVFEPLTLSFLMTWNKWRNKAPRNLVNYFFKGVPTPDRRQLVILARVLADEINVGYNKFRYNVISYVNGKKIVTMEDLVEAFEENEGKYHVIVDEWGHRIVLDKDKVDKYNHKILERYKIYSDRSEDLKR